LNLLPPFNPTKKAGVDKHLNGDRPRRLALKRDPQPNWVSLKLVFRRIRVLAPHGFSPERHRE
ncbi:MAG TPA: hypothetical protein PK867_27645, partial [Pirellulales bacterium]|nr:hypothetical protein [Pirellulales bacterium]